MIKKPVLILESRDFIVESKILNDDGTYTLGGIFAEFNGKKNNNGRIYEASGYLPHLVYLNQKINENRLFGELDHPEKFDVSLKKVSHMVTKLIYEEKTSTVRGEIRLFDTAVGRDAQAIIKGGGALSISSRAAGIVNESTSQVEIKKIFTYDLVSDPGFPNARMHKINESLGIDDPNVSVYEVTDEFINNVTDSGVKQALNEMMVELNGEDYQMLNEENTNKKTNNSFTKQNESIMNKGKMNKFVEKHTMNEYSKLITKEMGSIQNNIKSINEKFDGVDITKLTSLNESLEKLKKFNNYMVEGFNEQETKLDKVIKYLNHTTGVQNQVIGFVDHLAKVIGSDVNEVQALQEKQNQYLNYLANKQNEALNHSDYLTEGLNKIKTFADYLGKYVNESIGHTDHVAMVVEKAVGYLNYLAEDVNTLHAFADYLGATLDKDIQHGDHIAEMANQIIGYVEYGFRTALPALPNRTKLNENNNIESNNTSLSSKIASFKELIEKRKIDNVNESNVESLLSEKNAIVFKNLNPTEKQKVVTAVLENNCENEENVMMVMEQVLITPDKQRKNLLLKHMPNGVKDSWEKLTESQQTSIFENSKKWDISNVGKIKDFWFHQRLTEQKDSYQLIQESLKTTGLYANNVNESQNNSSNMLGYNTSHILANLGFNPPANTDSK